MLLLTTTSLVETSFPCTNVFSCAKVFLLQKCLRERFNGKFAVQLCIEFRCLQGSPSVVYRMMGPGRLAAIPSFLGSLLCDRRKAHLNSLFFSLLITDEEGHLLLSGAAQAPRKFMIRPPA